MDLYQASVSKTLPNGILSHFGSLSAAAWRMDSRYNAIKQRAINQKGEITIFDMYGRPQGTETPQQGLESFAAFMQQTAITSFSVKIEKPLFLTDCWLDDPIGSGALDIFKDNKELLLAHRQELAGLFSPFTEVIYPNDIRLAMLPSEVYQIKSVGEEDPVFVQEFEKRRQRSTIMGEDWRYAEPQEIVWTNLSVKLRRWALENEYDGFEYRSTQEDAGSTCYVTLNPEGIQEVQEQLKFDTDKYMETVGPVFEEFVGNLPKPMPGVASGVVGVFWAGHNPKDFWIKDLDFKP